MTHQDLIFLADLNYAESMREIARWRVDSENSEQDDLLMVAGGDSTPVTNSAMRLGNHSGPPAEDIMNRVRGYFGNRNRGYSLHIRRHLDSDLEELCRSSKMAQISESPGMAIQEPIRIKELPVAVTLKSIYDKSGTNDFASVTIASYQSLGMAAETGGIIFETPEKDAATVQLYCCRLSG